MLFPYLNVKPIHIKTSAVKTLKVHSSYDSKIRFKSPIALL
ncbi:hypothetical protein PFLA_a2468 [Pseudoalteromonas flavipulchra NCIMB 2033 = ATCC BAA-314]|nr:hypothetical protein [Pseudoalteromonas flavipulchra NCIMB 2033 = ATCC BAA-314]